MRSDAVKSDPDGPVPLVSYGGDSTCQRAAVASLHRAGLDCNFVFTSQSNASLLAAVAAGFGVMAVPRGRAVRNNLVIWEDLPLPKLPELYCALVVREGGDRTAIEELADYLEDQIRVEPNSLGFVGAPRWREPIEHDPARAGFFQSKDPQRARSGGVGRFNRISTCNNIGSILVRSPALAIIWRRWSRID